MIGHKAILASRDLVGAANHAGVTLTGHPSTPLAILNKCVARLSVNVDEEEATPIEEGKLSDREMSLSKASMELDNTGSEAHSVELGTIAKHVSGMVANSLNYARNVVNPLVSSILEEAKSRQGEAMLGSNNSRPIVMLFAPEVYFDGMLDSILDKAKSKSSAAMPLSSNMADMLFTDMTEEIFLKAIKFNSSGFDAKVFDLYSSSSIEEKRDFLRGYCVSTAIDVNNGYRPYTNHSAMLGYLFLVGVKNGNLDTVDYSSMSADEKQALVNAIEYYGYMVNYQVDRFLQDGKEENGSYKLVESFETDYSKIAVIGDNYKTWLEVSGGTPEAVMGYVGSVVNVSPSIAAQRNLYTNPGMYADMYARTCRTETAEGRIRANSAVDKVLKAKLFAYINSEYAEDTSAKRELQDKVIALVDAAPYTHAIPLDMHILRNVCGVICTGKNDAFEILTTMRGYLNDNTDATPQEAALVAASKVIGRWVASQIAVNPR
jgi:hypothetical protein